jgi:1-acyl-sn-glycerol-3-phosphate acyltransferase
MLGFLRGVRSLFSVLLVVAFFMVGALVLRLGVVPAVWLFPRRQLRLASWMMKFMSRGILGCVSIGGGRVRRSGSLDASGPVVIVANHQGLTDILQATLLARDQVPAFVTRRRYARFVPVVSACIRLVRCPIVDPRRDPRGALDTIGRAARELPHGLLIFPEGHRSRDGALRPFHGRGLETLLRERPSPVQLVLNDGVWRARTFVDAFFRVHLIDAWSEVLGPFEVPRDPDQLPRFVDGLRETLDRRLAEHRREDATTRP